MGEYFAFTEDIKKSGHYVGGEALQPVSTATTVRVRSGKMSTTDGPFAETKEQLGGYYLIERQGPERRAAGGVAHPVGQDRHGRGAADSGVQLGPVSGSGVAGTRPRRPGRHRRRSTGPNRAACSPP